MGEIGTITTTSLYFSAQVRNVFYVLYIVDIIK